MTKERPGRPRMRLFVALELPSTLTEPIEDWRASVYAGLPEFRIPRSTIHVTLVFLGYQYVSDLERVAQLSFAQKHGPFELRVSEVTALPARRPRLHALELEDRAGSLAAWQIGIAERLAREGLYELEKRPFRPHVTVARVKRGKEREAAQAGLPEFPQELCEVFHASRATVFRSTLEAAGAIYEPVASIELT